MSNKDQEPIITKELLIQSITEHEAMQKMVSTNKYQMKRETCFQDVLQRVASVLPTQAQKDLIFYRNFIPAGSILAGLGNTDYKCSLSNCYLTPIESDSIEGIFNAIKNLARTFSYRGGSGVILGILRPAGAPVSNAAKTSSGAVSFMPSFDMAAKTIGTSGRRAALLMGLDIRHPDIPMFIRCKSDPELVFGRDSMTGYLPDISGANISVLITDAFMQAVEDDDEWQFKFPQMDGVCEVVYQKEWDGDYDKWEEKGLPFKDYGPPVSARQIMMDIAEAAHKCGDPGVLFMSTVQEWTMGTFIHESLKPVGCNPCGEQDLENWGACNLGAMVLPNYIAHPFTPQAEFDMATFKEDVATAVEIMNIYSDINQDKHPLPEQRETDKFGKRIGIEVTGLGDMLAMLNLPYESEKARDFVSNLFSIKAVAEVKASIHLAKHKGPAPALRTLESRLSLINSPYMTHLLEGAPPPLTIDLQTYGMANTGLNTVGPCGSISIMSGNCTSGIEPLFKFAYTRKNRIDNKAYSFIHKPAAEYMLANLPTFEGMTLSKARKMLNYTEAEEIPFRDRIGMQSRMQTFTDSAISSTINLPKNATPDDILNIYIDAHRAKLKGITVFRDGCKEGIFSAMVPTPAPAPTPKPIQLSLPQFITKDLLDVEQAERHRVIWKKSKVYINVSLDSEGNPLEVFAKLPVEAGINGNGIFSPTTWQERTSNWDLTCRLISLLLRMGTPLEDVLKQLNRSTYSMVDAAGILKRVLHKYLKQYEEDEDGEETETEKFHTCPSCKAQTYIYEGGCGICRECAYTECG